MNIDRRWKRVRKDNNIIFIGRRDLTKAMRQLKGSQGVYGTLKVLGRRRSHPSVKDRRRAKDRMAAIRWKRRQDLKTGKWIKMNGDFKNLNF